MDTMYKQPKTKYINDSFPQFSKTYFWMALPTGIVRKIAIEQIATHSQERKAFFSKIIFILFLFQWK